MNFFECSHAVSDAASLLLTESATTAFEWNGHIENIAKLDLFCLYYNQRYVKSMEILKIIYISSINWVKMLDFDSPFT